VIKQLILTWLIFECMQWCCSRLLRKHFGSSIFVCIHACTHGTQCLCIHWNAKSCVKFDIPHECVCHVRMYCMYFVLYIRTVSSKAYVNCSCPWIMSTCTCSLMWCDVI
jgi:hypothetical protein